MKPILIGLTGKRRVGKSTVASELCRGYDTAQLSFATPIKRMISAMGIEDHYVYGDGKEEVIPGVQCTGRFLLQSLGTEWGRDIVHPNLWVDLLFSSPRYHLAMGYRGVVIDDVRFPSEVEAIRANGGYVARVQWGEDVAPVIDDHHDQHLSESVLPDVDYVIKNSTDLSLVRAQLAKMLVDLKCVSC